MPTFPTRINANHLIFLKRLNRNYQHKVHICSPWKLLKVHFYIDDAVFYVRAPYINMFVNIISIEKFQQTALIAVSDFISGWQMEAREWARHCGREEKRKVGWAKFHSRCDNNSPTRKSGGPPKYFNSGTDPFVSIMIICPTWSNGTPIHWNPILLPFSPEGKLLYCRAIKEKWKYLRCHNYRGGFCGGFFFSYWVLLCSARPRPSLSMILW